MSSGNKENDKPYIQPTQCIKFPNFSIGSQVISLAFDFMQVISRKFSYLA
jgi:hypothetical protein